MPEQPYLSREVVAVEMLYNPAYGDSRICICKHIYSRHFDSYDNMSPVGCKYCFCGDFREAPDLEGMELWEAAKLAAQQLAILSVCIDVNEMQYMELCRMADILDSCYVALRPKNIPSVDIGLLSQ